MFEIHSNSRRSDSYDRSTRLMLFNHSYPSPNSSYVQNTPCKLSPFSGYSSSGTSPRSISSYHSVEEEKYALDVIMDDLLTGFEHNSPCSSNTPHPSGSRKGSQETENDPELDRLLDLIQQNSSTDFESESGTASSVQQSGNSMDQSADLQVKTEPFQTLSMRGQQHYDFLHPGYAQMGFMGLNPSIQCDFVQQQGLMQPQGVFAQPGFLYPNAPPFPDSRRGSQGTASSNSTSHTGSPSPLTSAAAPPQSPPFNAQQFLRFGMFNPNDFNASSSQTLMSSEEDADKLCAVCNDRAVCLHYGARTCEGCKGFFKRTVQKKSKYVCAGNRNCPIDKRYRSRCQYCRFQKCLSVGMVKEIVRHGVLSGRRGRLSSKTKTVRSDEQQAPPLPMLGLIVRAHDSYKPTIHTSTHFPSLTETQLLGLLENEYQYIAGFLHSIPQTGEICPADTSLLLARSFFPIMAVRHCKRVVEGNIAFETGEHVAISGLPEPFARFFRVVREEAANFQNLVDWEPQSYCALQAMQFLAGNTPESNPLGLTDRGAIERVQSSIVNALKDHCATAAPNKLAKIVQQIDKFDLFYELGVELLEHCVALQVRLPPPLMAVCQMPRTSLRVAEAVSSLPPPQQHPINFSIFH